jgi:hypothetical protein
LFEKDTMIRFKMQEDESLVDTLPGNESVPSKRKQKDTLAAML